MTRIEWLTKCAEHAEALRGLVRGFHPSYRRQHGMRITASRAEAACADVRKKIAAETDDDPVARFDRLLAGGDLDGMTKLLNEAWFGVPESTDCWGIPGFREAVSLLEDTPDEEVP